MGGCFSFLIGGIVKGNSEKIISAIKNVKADIVVFPELSITGYSPQDLLLRHNFIDENLDTLKKIISNTKNKTAIVGFVDKINQHIYNSAAIIRNQHIIEVHHKICLPNYAIFDEKRWFMEGKNATIFESDGKKIGVSICEDIWFPETTKKQKYKGADFITNISASPFHPGKIEIIENILRQRWNENKIPILYVNQAGSQDGIVYYGHSMYFNDGKVVKKCKDFDEDLMIVNV